VNITEPAYVCVPADTPDGGLTETMGIALAAPVIPPVDGVIESQELPEVTEVLNASGEPVLVTVTGCEAGILPSVEVKVIVVGLNMSDDEVVVPAV
jgi:hypothetical protein